MAWSTIDLFSPGMLAAGLPVRGVQPTTKKYRRLFPRITTYPARPLYRGAPLASHGPHCTSHLGIAISSTWICLLRRMYSYWYNLHLISHHPSQSKDATLARHLPRASSAWRAAHLFAWEKGTGTGSQRRTSILHQRGSS